MTESRPRRSRRLWRWIPVTLLIVAAAVTAVALLNGGGTRRPLTGNAQSPGKRVPHLPFFVIGVFDQPSYSFPKWRMRGINTIISFQSLSGTVPYTTWRAQLGQEQLYAIRAPQGDPRIDARDPRLLAFLQPDEPDIFGSAAREVAQNYRYWHARAPEKPVLENFAGGKVQSTTRSAYQAFLKTADWVSNDLYPIAGFGAPAWLDLRQPESDRIGVALTRLFEWSGGKPQFQILEASPQGLPGHGAATVNGDQLRGTVWHAIIHGVSGVIYFPQAIGPSFQFDAAPPDVVASMTTVDAQLARLSPVLVEPNLPATAPVPVPFERARKRYDGTTYTFTLNFSPAPAVLDGRYYGPYDVTVATDVPTTGSAVGSSGAVMTVASERRRRKKTDGDH